MKLVTTKTMKSLITIVLVTVVMILCSGGGMQAKATTSGDIKIDNSSFPDDSFRNYVLEEIDTDDDNSLSQTEIEKTTSIEVSESEISDLKGIEFFTELEYLDCSSNRLTELNVDMNTKLTVLNCCENQIESLNVSSNTNLTDLNCYENKLTNLDVSKNKDLNNLSCGYNQLTRLDVKNNTQLTFLSCSNNKLSELNISGNTEVTDLSCGRNQLTSLDVKNNTQLTYLSCSNNKLSELNISGNTELTDLSCEGNQLTSLDLSGKTGLTSLDCSNNRLTGLTLSGNTNLTELYCSKNQLTSLDVSGNTDLTKLNCSENHLTSLTLGGNTNLTELNCSKNLLTSLNVSENTGLKDLDCCSNYLVNLDVKNNKALINLNCSENQLTSLDLSQNSSLDWIYLYGQMITLQATSKDSEYQVDLGKLVGSENVQNIDSVEEYVDEDNGESFRYENGIVHIDSGSLPTSFGYNYTLTDKFEHMNVYIDVHASPTVTYKKKSNGMWTFMANGDIDEITEIKVDDTTVQAEKYTTVSESGAIKFKLIMLKKEYIDTLEPGEHTLTVVYQGGQASTSFKIISPDKIIKKVDVNAKLSYNVGEAPRATAQVPAESNYKISSEGWGETTYTEHSDETILGWSSVWYANDDNYSDDDVRLEQFKEGKEYEFFMVIDAKEEYEFAESADEIELTINGEPVDGKSSIWFDVSNEEAIGSWMSISVFEIKPTKGDVQAHTVTFNANGGTNLSESSRTVSSGTEIGQLPTVSRTGYTFDGWYTQANGGTPVTASTHITSDQTLYAHWRINSYTVTFDANGGSNLSASNVAVSYGNTIGQLPTVSRPGYTFDGWYTQASGGTLVTATTPITYAQTLYAHWSINSYTVTFDANGGSNLSASNVAVSHGNAIGKLPTVSRTGYTFKGWYTKKSGGTNISTTTPITYAQTLYAQWTKKTYTVKFNANGGKNLSKSSISVTSGKKISKLPTVKKKGYTLKGWYTKKKGGNRFTTNVKVKKAYNLYAQWTKVTVMKASKPAVKKAGKGKLSVKIGKVTGAKGYQISYSTSSKFKGVKTVTLTGRSKTISKLKSKKTYYVKVRAYKKDSYGNKVYGPYSKIAKVKVK